METISFNEFNSNLDLEPIKFSLTQREDGPNWPFNKVEALETWYRRFLYLSSIYNEKIIVPSKDIDTFWHTHILDTQKYIYDCENLFGRYLHHFPYFGMRGKQDRIQLEISFKETEDLFFLHFGESPISNGMADCGSLCNEPTPKFGHITLCPKYRPTLSETRTNQIS
jgi:hypothetical protein